MSTPLFKNMKQNSSTFYSFPSTSMNPNPNFTKFVLLNIPNVIDDTDSVTGVGRLDFEDENFHSNTLTYDIYSDKLSSDPSYSKRLVESLRNYVANHDETMRNSRITQTKDFYNIKEKQTPTEIIFWKWLKKMKVIDFEVAKHKVDWDKNHPDFDNSTDTLSNTDYFRKYLWKERETISYTIETISEFGNDLVEIIISYNANYRIKDKILLSNNIGTLSGNTEYELVDVEYGDNITKVYITDATFTGVYSTNLPTIKLSYHRLIQYIGEINVKSDVKTSRKDETEIMAYIPHQAGRTPSVLFQTRFDTNYYPGLTLPILSEQKQSEILGAENLDSPIRQRPNDYPGAFYGQFDTSDKTYQSSTGDKFRYSGDYFGINRNNNTGLSDPNYFEYMNEFDSTYLDGINIDFNLNHYYKMSLTDKQIGFNFDEFNQITIDNIPPQSFEYNAILWYYEVDGNDINDNNIYTNLYGITFLNNPDDNINDNTLIETYKKLVSSDEHDGLSYIHTLNLSTSVDNNVSSMKFDPLTINNTFGFDLYQNVMSNVAKLNESFINITTSFLNMNNSINDMKTLIYTQTDIDLVKSKLKNLDDLLKLYQKYQFVDSKTVSIIPDYSGTYPTLSFDVKQTEYSSIYNIKSSDIYNYKVSNGTGYKITVPDSNKLLVKVTNDDVTDYGDLVINLNSDLKYRQSSEFYISCDNSCFTNELSVFINFYDENVGYSQNTLLLKHNLPNDIGYYLPTNRIYNKTYYNNTSVYQTINLVDSKGTTSVPYTLLYTTTQNYFGSLSYEETVYIDNFKFLDVDNNIIDKSSVYKIGKTEGDFNEVYFKISLDTSELTPISTPIAYLIKKIKINIIRIDESNTSSISDRYLIEKTYI